MVVPPVEVELEVELDEVDDREELPLDPEAEAEPDPERVLVACVPEPPAEPAVVFADPEADRDPDPALAFPLPPAVVPEVAPEVSLPLPAPVGEKPPSFVDPEQALSRAVAIPSDAMRKPTMRRPSPSLSDDGDVSGEPDMDLSGSIVHGRQRVPSRFV
jgi:hypothetical protein